MFTSNSTKLNSVPIIAYNSNVHFARNVPFSQTRLPEHALQQLEMLWLESEALQPLPMCLPGLISRMNRLSNLRLYRATEVTLTDTLHTLAQAPICTLERLDLSYSQFSPPAMHALCAALLGLSKSLAVLLLADCGLTDGLACILATALHGLPGLMWVYLEDNTIGDKGAVAIAGALHGLPGLEWVHLRSNTIGDEGAVAIAGALHGLPGLKGVYLSDNTFGGRGRAALNKCKKIKD